MIDTGLIGEPHFHPGGWSGKASACARNPSPIILLTHGHLDPRATIARGSPASGTAAQILRACGGTKSTTALHPCQGPSGAGAPTGIESRGAQRKKNASDGQPRCGSRGGCRSCICRAHTLGLQVLAPGMSCFPFSGRHVPPDYSTFPNLRTVRSPILNKRTRIDDPPKRKKIRRLKPPRRAVPLQT